MPKISVIMPTYNSAKYLAEAIDSVLCQTYQDFEIVIIDDGSTDNTAEIVERYLNGKVASGIEIKYFYQKNKGRSAARNAGIKKATGDYIAFLDSDDLMLPNNLQYKIDFAENKKIKFISSDYYRVNNEYLISNLNKNLPYFKSFGLIPLIESVSKGYKKDKGLYTIPKMDFLKIALKIFCVNSITVFIQRDFLAKAKALFDTGLTMAEDDDMWGKLLLSPYLQEVGYIDEPLSIYRFYNAKWSHDSMHEYYRYIQLTRFIKGVRPYKRTIGNNYFAEVLWNLLWQFKAEKKKRYYFYKNIFLTYPWKIKYWKSFFAQCIRDIFSKIKK